VAGFVAIEECEGFGLVGETAEGEGQAAVAVGLHEFFVDVVLLAFHFQIQQCAFHREDSLEAPAGRDELFDETVFDGALGFEVGHAGLSQVLIFLFGFVGEDEVFRVQAVGDGVDGGAGGFFGGLAGADGAGFAV
jgi:hypothetical protein